MFIEISLLFIERCIFILYGVENVFQSGEVKAKIVETNLKNLGVENPRQSKEIEERIKQTCLEHYGVEYVTQTENFKEKSKQTLMEHYGVEHQMFAQEIKDKLKETVIENFGVEHVFQNEDVKKKIVKTNLENYGTNYFTQSKTFKDIIRKKFYNTLLTQNRLQQRVVPLFNLEDYVDTDGSYKFKCCACGNEFNSNLSDGHIPRCMICYPPLAGTSKIEVELVKHIKSFYNGEIVCNTRKVLTGLELDIYLPERKLAIEVNGIYWHSELNGKDKNYHLNKTLECESKGIRLIHVFEDELMNKCQIVYNKINHILGNTKYKIGARKCEVKEIEALESNTFLYKYHIQGKDNAGIRLGMFYKNRLVAVMTFCKNRIALGRSNVDGEFELSRFATIAHFNIMGAGDKMLKHFERNFKPTKVLSYADRRWSNGNLYFKLGFKLDHISKPNYWYVKNGQREHRFKYRKDVLLKEGFDASLTEWQIMQEKGYDRIWDCGNYVFVKEL